MESKTQVSSLQRSHIQIKYLKPRYPFINSQYIEKPISGFGVTEYYVEVSQTCSETLDIVGLNLDSSIWYILETYCIYT